MDCPVFYINLEERQDRKQHIEAELQALGISNIRRISAIKQEKGWLGCTMSHILAVGIAKKLGHPKICIMEDDMRVINKEQFQENLTKAQELPDTDVLFLGGNILEAQPLPTNDRVWKLKKVCSSVAYILHQSFYEKWIQNLRESIEKKVPLDVHWQTLISQNNAYIIQPLCVSQLNDYSNIEKKVVDYDWLMLTFPKPRRKSENQNQTQHFFPHARSGTGGNPDSK